MSECTVSYKFPENNLGFDKAVEVLKEFEQFRTIRVLCPSELRQADSAFSVRIFGKLKFDQLTERVVIREQEQGGNFIKFHLTSDLEFDYLDWFYGDPDIGATLTIVGPNGFSMDIDEMIDKDEDDEEITDDFTVENMLIEIEQLKKKYR